MAVGTGMNTPDMGNGAGRVSLVVGRHAKSNQHYLCDNVCER